MLSNIKNIWHKKRVLSLGMMTVLIFGLTACDRLPISINKKNSTSPNQAVDTPPSFVVSTLPYLPGFEITSSQGYYCRMFEFFGQNYSELLNQAMKDAIKEGESMGGQALLNMRFYTVNFEAQNAQNTASPSTGNTNTAIPSRSQTEGKRNASIIKICGDLVQLSKYSSNLPTMQKHDGKLFEQERDPYR